MVELDPEALEAAARAYVDVYVAGLGIDPASHQDWVDKTWKDHIRISETILCSYLAERERQGFVEVPREPTEAMLEAGMDADTREWRRTLGDIPPTVYECQANDWRAMISAHEAERTTLPPSERP